MAEVESETTTSSNSGAEIFLHQVISRALGNHLVLVNIMNFMSYDDVLENCSLVNSTWRTAAVRELNKWTTLNVLVRNWTTTQSRLQVGLKGRVGMSREMAGRYEFISVQTLEEKLMMNKKIRIELILSYNKLMQDEEHLQEMHRSIDLVSPKVVTVSITDTREYGINLDHEPYFRIETPQLQKICIRSMTHSCLLAPGHHTFPLHPIQSVRTIEFGPDFNYLWNNTVEILDAVPNALKLKNIPKSFKKDFLNKFWHVDDEIEGSKLVSIIQRFSSTLFGDKMELTISFEKCPKTASPCWKSDYFGTIFFSILGSSCDSLKTLEICFCANLTSLQFPRLENLTSLELTVVDADFGVGGIFCSNFDLDQIFPKLVNLEIVGLHRTQIDMGRLLPSNIFYDTKKRPPLPGLNCLTLKNVFASDANLHWTIKVFPQIHTLNIQIGRREWSDILSAICSIGPAGLQYLALKEFYCERTMSMDSFFLLDEIFTGFSQINCTKLRESPVKLVNIDLNSYCEGPGISNLKNLKRLSMEYHECSSVSIRRYRHFHDQGHVDNPAVPIFSHLSCLYGFQLVSGLQVDLTINTSVYRKPEVDDSYRPIIPLVNFEANTEGFTCLSRSDDRQLGVKGQRLHRY